MSQKFNIILFGDANTGKTTTLMYLASLLAGNGSIDKTIQNSIDSCFGVKTKGSGAAIKKYEDARLIVEYKGKTILIATGGDSWLVSRNNYDFFTGMYNNLVVVYYVDTTGVKQLSNPEKEKYKRQDHSLSICACRPSGDNYGAIKAIHSYSESYLDNCEQQIWIHKKNESNITNTSNMTDAKKLLKIIDELLGI